MLLDVFVGLRGRFESRFGGDDSGDDEMKRFW
jgi:hypothetical protein